MRTRLGLTGGIGSGKSTIAAMLVERGAALIDSDAISRQLTAVGGGAIEPISQAFGPQYIASDGSLDRNRMRTAVFGSSDLREKLEAILHPLIQLESLRQSEAAMRAGQRVLVFDIPLLTESGYWRRHLDQVLVIDCDPETQIRRTMARSQLQREAIEHIIAAQASRQRRLQAADLVIFNGGQLDLPDLTRLAGQIATRFGL